MKARISDPAPSSYKSERISRKRRWQAGSERKQDIDGSRSQCESQHGTRGLTTDDGTNEIEEDDEPHREETESAHLGQEVQLSEVVDGGVDPSSTLAEGGKEKSGRSENSVGAS